MFNKTLPLTTCLLALSLSPSAQADDKQEARELMVQGLEAEEAQDLDAAREAYKKSLDLHPSFDVAGNLGMVEYEMGRYLDAVIHLDHCLRNFPTGENRELLAAVKDTFAKARQYTGAVLLTVNDDGAEVSIDERFYGKSPFEHELYVMPGSHTITATSDQGTAEQRFQVGKGETIELNLKLGQEEQAAPVVVEDAPSALDDAPESESAAAHKGPPTWLWLTGTVVAAAGLGTGIGMTVAAGGTEGKADDLQSGLGTDGCWGSSPPAQCSELASLRGQYDTQTNIAMAGFITAGVAAAGTLAVLLLWPKGEKGSAASQRALAVTPVISPWTQGLILQSSF